MTENYRCFFNLKNNQMITLKTLSQATAQEVYDQVANHLLIQNKKSISLPSLACMYKNIDGLKCAAGCLMSDEEYLPRMGNLSWAELIIQGLVPENHRDLIIKLQSIHDVREPYEWKGCLIKLANNLRLIPIK